jgi:hypothetical protein
MKLPGPTPEGDLPALRTSRALEAAVRVGRSHKVEKAKAREIAHAVIDAIAEGTYRCGNRCPKCHTEVTWPGVSIPVCPNHGSLRGEPMELMISFPPVVAQ